MQKTITSCCRRLFAVVAIVAGGVMPAGAYDYYYALNVELEAYPTGAGKVYASGYDQDMYKDQSTITGWTDKMNMKLASDYKALVVWGQPADGWQLGGYQLNMFKDGEVLPDGNNSKEVVYDAEGNVVYDTRISYPSSPVVFLQSNITATDDQGNFVKADSAEVAKLAPETPNNYVRVLFTRVRAVVAEGQSGLGGAGCTPFINNIGDRVMLIAGPQGVSKFEGWYLNGKRVSDEPTFTITVTECATYEARFSNELACEVSFPIGGGTKEWYSDYDYELTDYVTAYSPTVSTVKMRDVALAGGTRETWLNMQKLSGDYTVLEGKRPALIHGSGTMTLYPKQDTPALPKTDNFFQWSGEEGVRLVSGNNYYTLSSSGEFFELEEGGTIGPNRIYFLLPENMLNPVLGVPKIIYIDETAYTNGIDDVKTTLTSRQKGIFTLDGRHVDQMERNGIYVTDGKKVYYRQK